MKTFEQFISEKLKDMFAFNQKVYEILEKAFGKEKLNKLGGTGYAFPPTAGGMMSTVKVETKYGELSISLHNDKSEVYSIFMRFNDPKLANQDPEIKGVMNSWSGKWNIHMMDEGAALLELEDRIRNLTQE